MKGLTTPLSRWLRGSYLFVSVWGTRVWSPTGLIPWFSKTEGNTYATLLHHPFIFKGKPTQCSRGSKKDFWRRWRGDLRQVKTYQVPITTLILHITLFSICLSFSSPPLHPCRSIRPLSVRLFSTCFVVMASPLSTSLSPEKRHQKSLLLPLEHCVGFPLKRKGWCSKAA